MADRATSPPTAPRRSTDSSWVGADDPPPGVRANASLDCGWGRLLFGQTFAGHEDLAAALRDEPAGRRNLALYVRDPQVLVATSPDDLFVDPSLTFRYTFADGPIDTTPAPGLRVRPLADRTDVDAAHGILARHGMLTGDADVVLANQATATFTYLVADDVDTGDVVGVVTGVDHVEAFGDPEHGTSLWELAVDPAADRAGVGATLVRALLGHYCDVGRAHLDLSVLHDQPAAINLYRKLGFARVPVFCVKRRNAYNQPLYTAAVDGVDELNPYARLIAEEATRRGIRVEVVDADGGYLRLSLGRRTIVTRESLSELTTAVAMSRCDDKRVTHRLLTDAGLRVPRHREASFDEGDAAFLDGVGELVVKPARGEQGDGVTVGVRDADHLADAIAAAREHSPVVLLEECIDGEDLRVIVIGHEAVAAAVRRPAEVTGTGEDTIADLIAAASEWRAAETDGEAAIPDDDHTRRTVADAGHALDDVLGGGEPLAVRRTANLHTGGAIHDVTDRLHPALARACVEASRALDIPLVGLDLLVPVVEGDQYVVIEANEWPGLANHEPQPTAQRFIDLLFPLTARRG